MPSDKLRRLWALEAEAAPVRTIIVVGDDPDPTPEPGVRIMRVETGVPRGETWGTYDAPPAHTH